MKSEPEFSRPVRIDTIGAAPRPIAISADERERAALARRFDLARIDRLEANAELVRDRDSVITTGTLRAAVTQNCVATGLPVEAGIGEEFRIVFRPEPAANEVRDEVELSADECDVIFYSGAEIDLGEAIAETLSLSLDPWPRAPHADEMLRQAGVKSEAEAGPFGALAALRDRLGK